MEGFLYNLLLFLTVFFVASNFAILLLFVRSLREFQRMNKQATEKVPEKTREKSEAIIHEAISKANDILAKAEKQGVDILAKEESKGTELTSDYGKHLQAIEDALKAQFDKSAKEAEAAYSGFIGEAQSTIHEHLAKNEQVLEEKASAVITETDKLLKTFTEGVQEKVRKEVDVELEAARNEIDEYKHRRLAVIDERIIEMLEDVIKVALEKKLSLAEQSELVYKALEEAKHENAFK